MSLYPVFLELSDVPCAVVGGGAVAERKVLGLLAAGAAVTVIAPTLSDRLVELVRDARIVHENRPYASGDARGFRLLFAATDRREVNEQAAREAREAGAWANVADDLEGSTFTVPSSVRRGDLTLAISTGGASPAEARRVREELEAMFPERYAAYLDLLRAVRRRLLERRGAGDPASGELFTRLVRSELRGAFLAGDAAAADAALARTLGEGYALADLGAPK